MENYELEHRKKSKPLAVLWHFRASEIQTMEQLQWLSKSKNQPEKKIFCWDLDEKNLVSSFGEIWTWGYSKSKLSEHFWAISFRPKSTEWMIFKWTLLHWEETSGLDPNEIFYDFNYGEKSLNLGLNEFE